MTDQLTTGGAHPQPATGLQASAIALAFGLLLGCAATKPPGPLLRPPLMEGVGQSTLAISTHSERAQLYFNQGLSLLHGFWYYEAMLAFAEAARLDSSSAMAHWGIYYSITANNKVGHRRKKRQALQRAKALMTTASAHEQSYIRASTLLDSLPYRRGGPAYVRQMQALIDQYPDDAEAKLILFRFLVRNRNLDLPPDLAKPRLQELLRDLLDSHPEHPGAHHYWIHLVEGGPHLQEALPSAKKLPSLTPNAGHLMHMPGHVYYRLGMYERARQAFIAAMKVDSSYMARRRVPVTRTWNYVHNLSYLLANCAEDGRYREGLQWAERLAKVPLHARRPLFFYQGRMALPRLHMRYGRWQQAVRELAKITANDTLAQTFAQDYANCALAYAKGMAAVAEGRLTAAAVQAEAIEEFQWKFTFSTGETRDVFYSRRRVNAISLWALDLKGHIHSARDESASAVDLLQQATEQQQRLGYPDPPKSARLAWESLGAAQLRAQHWQAARQAFAKALEIRPHNGHALWGVARSYELSGQTAAAVEAYRDFLRHWNNADEELPQMRHARAWLAARSQ